MNASGAFLAGKTDGTTQGTVRARGGLDQVIRTVGETPFVIFIDDFHYMSQTLQAEVARQVKAAAGNRLRIIIASVPHRSEDVVRSNAELVGRTANLDLQFWGQQDLAQIAMIGFPQLNVSISPAIAAAMAIEACGSPQLMQELCLQSCFVADFREASEERRSLNWDQSFKQKVLEQAAENTNRSDVLTAMHRGAKIRGTARKSYEFVDSSVGDVYTAVLLAIKSEPPTMEIGYPELLERVQKICLPDNSPSSSSIVSACQQLEIKAKLIRPKERIVEWEGSSSTLSIVDPYFLFYLRSSRKLQELSRVRQARPDYQEQPLPLT